MILQCSLPAAMRVYRTTKCRAHGHREITIQFAEEPLIPKGEQMLLDYFEGGVARGTKFLPGQTVQLGWATLLLCERADGTIGVQERELTPEPQWTEAVDRAVRDTWYQREVVASVGLLNEIGFPRQHQSVMVSECAMDASDTVITRLAGDGFPEHFSGWAVSCVEEHDHGERSILPLLAIAATKPTLVQFLALPAGTSVLVVFREKKDTPTGYLRVEPHVFRDGEELEPQPGSYLARLQASAFVPE